MITALPLNPGSEDPQSDKILLLQQEGLGFTLRVLTNWGTSKSRVSETPKRPKDSP